MIFLEPEGGLGNRLRAIHSAVRLSEVTGHSLVIRWVKKKGMMCLYKDLFAHSDHFTVKDTKRNLVSRGASIILPARLNDFIRRVRFDLVLDNREVQNVLKSKAEIQELVEGMEKIFIKTHHFFFEGENGFYAPAPSEEILSRVEEIVQQFHENTVGVHIRSTDNYKSKEMSPISLFLNRMEKELAHSPNTLFYLSTDSDESRKMLLKHFGSKKIIFQPNIELSRDSRAGIKDAYVDMLCLSRTRMIYGSYWSSFSAVAAAVGRVNKETLKIER